MVINTLIGILKELDRIEENSIIQNGLKKKKKKIKKKNNQFGFLVSYIFDVIKNRDEKPKQRKFNKLMSVSMKAADWKLLGKLLTEDSVIKRLTIVN